MNDLNAMLARLAEEPLPTNFEGLEARVLARITAPHAMRVSAAMGGVTIAAALVMGVVGAGIPAKQVRAVSLLSPLGPAPELAPSTLLSGEP